MKETGSGLFRRRLGLLLALVGASACNHPLVPSSSSGGTAGAGGAGTSGTGFAPTPPDGGGGSPPQVVGPLDVGRPVLRRLTNLEYDLTVRDLLGVPGPARTTFQPDEVSGDFDVIGDGQTPSNDARYEQYFNAADALGSAAFADPALRSRIVTCEPPTSGDPTCLRAIVTEFGLRAWRRPLADDEVGGLVALAQGALAEGASSDVAIERVVTALLSSAPFLLRIEFDPNPSSSVPHVLTPYELVSRLSYLLWSSMPDDRLFARARKGITFTDSELTAEVDRMLADPRADGFVEGFARQWLDFDRLATIQFEPTLEPDLDQPLRDAMGRELRLYFSAFVDESLDFRTFPGTDFNFVNARLARDYGMPSPSSGDVPARVVDLTDARAGFLGLGGFLMMTSTSGRSSPTARAEWILGHLLCAPPPGPPPGTPDYISPTRPGPARVLVDSIHAQTGCASCHDPMDGIGMALEEFDDLGRFRTAYADGSAVDTKGAFVGQAIDGEAALADAVGHDPRLLSCASRQVMSFAVNRTLGDSDKPYADQILTQWTSGTPTLRALIKNVVLNDTFRFRHGEATP